MTQLGPHTAKAEIYEVLRPQVQVQIRVPSFYCRSCTAYASSNTNKNCALLVTVI